MTTGTKTAKAPDAVAEAASRLLADSYTLYLKTHNYHWNVVGPMFNTLHTLFETHYTELALAVDEIAERIRAVGHHAPGSYREFGRLTSIQEAVPHTAAKEMIAHLAADHMAVAASAKALVEAAGAADDDVSADLGTRRQDVHQKAAWMLRSHLEG
jgi:starvation-inducible DNA-binding protein